MTALVTVVTTTLIRSDKDYKQKPVYFVSKMLMDVETRYTNFECITLALKMAEKKIRPYFQTHTIIVLTRYSIRAILHKPNASGGGGGGGGRSRNG